MLQQQQQTVLNSSERREEILRLKMPPKALIAFFWLNIFLESKILAGLLRNLLYLSLTAISKATIETLLWCLQWPYRAYSAVPRVSRHCLWWKINSKHLALYGFSCTTRQLNTYRLSRMWGKSWESKSKLDIYFLFKKFQHPDI